MPLKIPFFASCWYLMPVILATQEAEIRRFMVQSQPGQIVCKSNTLSQKNPSPEKERAQGVGPEFKLEYRKKNPIFHIFVYTVIFLAMGRVGIGDDIGIKVPVCWLCLPARQLGHAALSLITLGSIFWVSVVCLFS
jgi:hypothetical protein